MNEVDFSRMFGGRGYGFTMPVLIELKCPDKPSWYFTNDKFIKEYNGQIYKPAAMGYKFPTSVNGVPQGGQLEIEIDIHKEEDGYELLKWFDTADDRAEIEVIGLINEQGDISRASQLTQKHGTVSWDGERIIWNLGQDDRLNMQINPWVMDSDSLTG